jgi:hypothetical protein
MRRFVFGLALLVVLAPAGLVATPAQAVSPAQAAGPAQSAGAGRVGRLPIGPAGLPESRVTQPLAPGLTLTTISRGYRDAAHEFWTIGINIPLGEVPPTPDPDADQGALGTFEKATALAQQLTADPGVARELAARGWWPRVEPVDYAPRLSGYSGGLIGYTLRVGRYTAPPTSDDPLRTALASAHFSTSLVYTGQDGRPGNTGPWMVRVLTVDPHSFRGRIGSSTGAAVSGRETTTAMARAAGAIYAVNGGFFTIAAADGTPGVPTGLTVIDGTPLTASTNGRPALMLRSGRADIENLYSGYRLRIGGDEHLIDGLNRPPGVIRNCGGVGGDQPTQHPVHDFTCTDPDELVALTPQYGTAPPRGDGVEVLAGPNGVITAVRSRAGQAVPSGSTLLQATGADADWLSAHAAVGRRLQLDTAVTDPRGHRVRFGPGDFVLNGGPRLLSHGRISINLDGDGLLHEDPALHLPASALGASFGYAWFIRDNPRTGVGTDPHGRLLIAEVDGRQDAFSQGLPIKQFADVFKALGATDAINLDGGGSSAAVVNGQLISSPSDTDAQGNHVERAVGDALIVTP